MVLLLLKFVCATLFFVVVCGGGGSGGGGGFLCVYVCVFLYVAEACAFQKSFKNCVGILIGIALHL